MAMSLHNSGLTRQRADLLYDQVFNVKSFGAKGDGITNDIDSFQAALDAAKCDLGAMPPIRPGKTLMLVPPGQYLLDVGATGRTSIVVPKGGDPAGLVFGADDARVQLIGHDRWYDLSSFYER